MKILIFTKKIILLYRLGRINKRKWIPIPPCLFLVFWRQAKDFIKRIRKKEQKG